MIFSPESQNARNIATVAWGPTWGGGGLSFHFISYIKVESLFSNEADFQGALHLTTYN